jgi:arylsulfatase A-like enzyme
MASTLDIAGIEKPDYVEFRSLLPLTKEKSKGNYASIYGAYLDLQRMVRVGDYKLIVYPEVPKAYLYNLKKDPQEMNNLADLPKFRKKKTELFDELLVLQQQYNDQLKLDRNLY